MSRRAVIRLIVSVADDGGPLFRQLNAIARYHRSEHLRYLARLGLQVEQRAIEIPSPRTPETTRPENTAANAEVGAFLEELGDAKPRRSQITAIAELRGIGTKEPNRRLEQLESSERSTRQTRRTRGRRR